MLAANRARGLNVVVGQAPGHGESRRRNMLALALKTGALLFEENNGFQIANCGLERCGQIAFAQLDSTSTLLQGFPGMLKKVFHF